MSACPHTEQFLLEQLSRHPASQLQDLRKALYQSAFGCGHLVEDPSAAADWIRRETAESASASQEVERLDGPWSRVPLGMLADGLTPETLAAAFAGIRRHSGGGYPRTGTAAGNPAGTDPGQKATFLSFRCGSRNQRMEGGGLSGLPPLRCLPRRLSSGLPGIA